MGQREFGVDRRRFLHWEKEMGEEAIDRIRRGVVLVVASACECCIQASRREYFGMSALLLRYISSSMFVVVTKGVPIRILRGLQS